LIVDVDAAASWSVAEEEAASTSSATFQKKKAKKDVPLRKQGLIKRRIPRALFVPAARRCSSSLL
jgi:hypothetical protein